MVMIKMIVVLCDSFKDAQDAYDIYVSVLEECEPYSIKQTYNAAYCVETDDDLRYIFIDRRLKMLFRKFDRPDEIDVTDFFDNVDRQYYGN